jgi:hypothetical protein
MRIYHGSSSPSVIERATEAAPSHTHGYCWTPQKMTPHDTPYILDNGAFSAFKNDRPWDVDAFVGRLSQLDSMPRPPDFVVLPDVVTNPEKTAERAAKWAGVIDETTAYPVQDGVEPEDAISTADRLGAETIFIGGTMHWKYRVADDFVKTAHQHGLEAHLARPGPKGLVWADSINADSADTSSIAANENYERLKAIEQGQQRLTG